MLSICASKLPVRLMLALRRSACIAGIAPRNAMPRVSVMQVIVAFP